MVVRCMCAVPVDTSGKRTPYENDTLEEGSLPSMRSNVCENTSLLVRAKQGDDMTAFVMGTLTLLCLLCLFGGLLWLDRENDEEDWK
jgi:hypothetical protein